MLIQQHMPYYITDSTAVYRMSLCREWTLGLWSVCHSNEPLAAGCTESGAQTEVEGGSAGAETREQAWPSPAGGPPPPLQPPSSLHVIPSPEASQQRKCQSSSQPGNLHAQTRRFLPWHSSSCGLCKDFPALSPSLPLVLSPSLALCMSLSPTLLAGCPSASCFSAILFLFFSLALLLGVWVCACMCVYHFCQHLHL